MGRRNGDNIAIQVGKNGFGAAQVQEVLKNLFAQKTVTLKFLKSFISQNDKKQVFMDVKKTITEKIKVDFKTVGNVMTIKRQK